jgi:peptidoglycan/LPS O-acetylase OafA/YrhL
MAARDASAKPADVPPAVDPPATRAPSAPAPSAWTRFFSLELLDNRYPALHGLRVIAILTVLQIHVTYIMAGDFVAARNDFLDPRFIKESYLIWFGMDLFFMLSGFLIGAILLRSLELQGTQNIRRFYLRRIFRTFPSYWVVLTVMALSITLTAMQRRQLPLEYVYATNFGNLEPQSVTMIWGWSLALEEQFYLVVPLLFFVLHRLPRDGHRYALLLGLWAVAPLVRLFIYLRGGHWEYYTLHLALYFRTHTRFDTLVAGILLVFVHRRYGKALGEWFKAPFHRALVGMLSLACLWLIHDPGFFGVEHALLVYVFLWGTVTSVMYFGPLLMLLNGEGFIHRALSAPAFRRIATLGYGVYLVHMPIIHYWFMPVVRALRQRGVSVVLLWPMTLLAVIVTSLTIAYALHVLVEKPSLRIRERFAS